MSVLIEFVIEKKICIMIICRLICRHHKMNWKSSLKVIEKQFCLFLFIYIAATITDMSNEQRMEWSLSYIQHKQEQPLQH